MFCIHCGAQLEDNARFCTKCGEPIGDSGAENGAGFEDDRYAGLDSYAEQQPYTQQPTAVIPPISNQRQTQQQQSQSYQQGQDQGYQYQAPSSQAPAGYQPTQRSADARSSGGSYGSDAGGGKAGPIIVIIVAIIAVLVAFVFIIKPHMEGTQTNSASTTTSATSSAASTSEASTASEAGSQASTASTASTASEATGLSEDEIYEVLSEEYDKIGEYDESVATGASQFNVTAKTAAMSDRQSAYDSATSLRDSIEEEQEAFSELDIPTTSKNYDAYQDMLTCYNDLYQRIDVICRAWKIDIKYSNPSNHWSEITAPLQEELESGTSDNKYYLEFNEIYPNITLKK